MLTLFLAFEDPAHAAGHAPGGDHGGEFASVLDVSNWLPGVTALLVFGIAFAILALKVWPQITKGLDDRERKIREEIESAQEAREQAKAALADYQKDLASAREQANQLIVKAKADAKAVADDLRSRNAQELAEMKTRATQEIEMAKSQAINAIYAEAAGLASAIAGKILQREINSSDQQRLVDDSLQELARSGRN